MNIITEATLTTSTQDSPKPRPPSRRGARGLITKPRPLAVIRNRRPKSVALLVPLRSVQFSSTMPYHTNQSEPNSHHIVGRCLTSEMTRKQGSILSRTVPPMRCFSANRGQTFLLRAQIASKTRCKRAKNWVARVEYSSPKATLIWSERQLFYQRF